jgi:hypothetical protein
MNAKRIDDARPSSNVMRCCMSSDHNVSHPASSAAATIIVINREAVALGESQFGFVCLEGERMDREQAAQHVEKRMRGKSGSPNRLPIALSAGGGWHNRLQCLFWQSDSACRGMLFGLVEPGLEVLQGLDALSNYWVIHASSPGVTFRRKQCVS